MWLPRQLPKKKHPEPKRKLSYKEQKEFEKIEKDLPAREIEKQQLTAEMSKPGLDFEKLQRMSERVVFINAEVEEMEMRWLELSEGV